MLLISMHLKRRCTSLRWSKITPKKNVNEDKSETFLLDLLLSDGFKA